MKMSKIQDNVGEWCEETFGPVQTVNSVLARANKEMSELIMAPYQHKSPRELIEECADVVICLYRYAHLISEDLDQAIIDKLAINRNRQWNVDGYGHGQHKKPNSPSEDTEKTLRWLYAELRSVNGITPAGKTIIHDLMNKLCSANGAHQ